jgi:hypothetical protein
MRRILLAALAVIGGGMAANQPTPVEARTVYPICMHWRATAPDCRYNSMAQCMASASGIGADCLYNPAYAMAPAPGYIVEDAPPPRRKRRPADY